MASSIAVSLDDCIAGYLLPPAVNLNIIVVQETKYTKLVSGVNTLKSPEELNQELRSQILGLPGVTERQNAGIHEDAFFVGGTMFMHVHGSGHCDIRLAKPDQEHVLAEGKAHRHRWAPEKGYVTFVVRNEIDLVPAMELIRMSYDHFASEQT